MRILTRSHFVLGALAIAIFTLVLLNARPASAFAYTVNTNSDSASDDGCGSGEGLCSLREAIEFANINPGADTIGFDQNVFTPGTFIDLTSLLPFIDAEDGLTIDGGANIPRIDGPPSHSLGWGLVFVTDDSHQTARNIVVRNIKTDSFSIDGVQVCPQPDTDTGTCKGDVDGVTMENVSSFNNNNDGVRILGDDISNIELDNVRPSSNENDGVAIPAQGALTNVSVTGGLADHNAGNGVLFSSRFGLTSNVTITGDESRNNGANGFTLFSSTYSAIAIQGVTATSNTGDAISVSAVSDLSGVTISGSSLTENVVGIKLSGNQPSTTMTGDTIKDNTVDGDQVGIVVNGSTVDNLLVEGNTVTNQSNHGMELQTRAGGTGNTIKGNTVTGSGGPGDGILVCCDLGDGNVHVTISRNATSGNGGLGIDLAASTSPLGVTHNDPGDGDTGPNDFLNYPEYGAFSDGGKTLNGTACGSCLVELFLSDNDPSGFGEGKTFLTDTHADPTGALSINLCGIGLHDNDIVTATATDLAGNTSEFSQNVLITGPLGDCSTATPVLTPTPSPTHAATHTPSPTPTLGPGQHRLGDLNCDNHIDGVDALLALTFAAGIQQPADGATCPHVGDNNPEWGDVDCRNGVDETDAIAILAFAAGASPLPQHEPCTNVGAIL